MLERAVARVTPERLWKNVPLSAKD